MVSSVDAGLSMQNVITAAESLGLGIVPIGGIRKSPDEIIDLLQLPEYTNMYISQMFIHTPFYILFKIFYSSLCPLTSNHQ